MIDPVEALRALLLAPGTPLSALLEDDATDELPLDLKVLGVPPGFGDAAFELPPRSVLLQPAPGPEGSSIQAIIESRFQMRCHGPTALDAWNVYRALWDVFYDANGLAKAPRLINNRWWLRSATLSQPFADIEPEGWPVVAATLTCRFDPHRQ